MHVLPFLPMSKIELRLLTFHSNQDNVNCDFEAYWFSVTEYNFFFLFTLQGFSFNYIALLLSIGYWTVIIR